MKSYVTRAAAIFAAMAVAGGAWGETQTGPDRLIAQWREQNGLCRGLHGDDPRMQPACDERQRIGRALDAQGWCYGREDQMAYEMDWHECVSGSLHSE